MRMITLWAGLGALSIATGSTEALAGPPSQGKTADSAAAAPAANAPAAKDGAAKGPNLEQMMAFFDKMFPPQPDPDPARLALARISVTPMWPDGAYGKTMTGFMGGMFDRFMELKKSDFATLGPKAEKAGASTGAKDLSMHEQMAAKDPHFDQRMAAMRAVIEEELGKLSAIVDPRIREGLARSMARRFDAQQLTDINAFFATKSGNALASHFMQLWVDPDTLRSLVGAMPEMMKLMPDAMQKIKEANDRFPKPPPAKEAKPAKQ